MGLSLWAIWIMLKHLPHCVGDFSRPVWLNQCQGVKETSGDSMSKHHGNRTFDCKGRFQKGIVGDEASEVQLLVLSPTVEPWKESWPLWNHQGFIGQILAHHHSQSIGCPPPDLMTPLGQGDLALWPHGWCATWQSGVWRPPGPSAFTVPLSHNTTQTLVCVNETNLVQ